MPRKSHPHEAEGGWRFTFNGHKYWFKTEALAWRHLCELRGEDAEGPKPPPLTIDSLVDQWEDVRGSEHAREMVNEFTDWTGGLALDDVEPDLLERYTKHLEHRKGKPRHGQTKAVKRLGLETVRKKVIHAAAALRWGHSRKMLAIMPDVPRLRKPAPRPKALSAAQVDDLFADLESSPKGKMFAPLVRFLLEVGCRPGEARLLQWSQIDNDRRVIVLPEHKTDKTAKPRVIPLTQTAWAILENQSRQSKWVFRSYRGVPYTKDGFAAICRRRHVHPYQFRHTWCQRACDRGVAEEIIQEIMGHGSAAMIRMYRRISDARMKAAVSVLDGLSLPSNPNQGPASNGAASSRPASEHRSESFRSGGRGSRQSRSRKNARASADQTRRDRPGERQESSAHRPARARKLA